MSRAGVGRIAEVGLLGLAGTKAGVLRLKGVDYLVTKSSVFKVLRS
jgi:hypothetical protein